MNTQILPCPVVDERELIERYIPLVRNVVDRIKLNLPAHVDIDDLYSVGVTGLISAVRKYDPTRDSTFASYATMRIRGEVLDELRRMDWCPRRARAKQRKIKEVVNEIEQATGGPAEEEEIQRRLGLSTKEFNHWMEETLPVTFVAIDGPADDGHEGVSLREVITDESIVLTRDRMEHDETLNLVAEKIRQLPDFPRKILAMYYFEGMRLQEIADIFGLTESRICQIRAHTMLYLRGYIRRASIT
jgi:RNA polymerase sigma factor for flagellar operon FliA